MKLTKQAAKNHVAKALDQPKDKPYVKRILVGLVAVTVTVSLGQLVLANYFSEKGSTLYTILQRKDELQQDNDILKAELARLTSLSYVAEQARLMGFVKAGQVVFVPQQQNTQHVALEPSTHQTP